MKLFSFINFSLFLLILVACQGSSTYRGKWKATGPNESKYEIIFDATSLSIKDSTGKLDQYNYTQTGIEKVNSSSIYKISIKGGADYKLHFSDASNNQVGYMVDEQGRRLYTLSRNQYLKFDEVLE